MLYQMSQNHYRIGSLLVDKQKISAEQLKIAIALQKQNREKQIGQILVERHFVSEKDLQSALRYQGWLKRVACAMAVSTSLVACGVPLKTEEGAISAGDEDYSLILNPVDQTPSDLSAEPTAVLESTPDSDTDPIVPESAPDPVPDPISEPELDLEPISELTREPEPTPESESVPAPEPVAMNVVLNWSPPLQREDGAEISEAEIESYQVHFYNETTGEIEEYTVSGELHHWNTVLPEGEYSFAVSAVDIYGLKSDLSELEGVVIE